MSFDPIGGMIAIVRVEDPEVTEKTLESRGFATTNIVNISDIMEAKKKENLFIAFGSEEEDAIDFKIDAMLERTPDQYDDIKYKKIKLPKLLKK